MNEFMAVIGGILADVVKSPIVQNAIAGIAIAVFGGASTWVTSKYSGWRRDVIMEALKVGVAFAEQKKKTSTQYSNIAARFDAIEAAKTHIPATAKYLPGTAAMLETGVDAVVNKHNLVRDAIDAAKKNAQRLR